MSRDERKTLLSHGAGGSAMSEFIADVFLKRYGPPEFGWDDSATLSIGSESVAFTTDSFVVSPLFFPGGDIGRLAVAGTVNDLLTAAAKPIALSASFIVEEGVEFTILEAIAESMNETADEAGVAIVTGDTKVVPVGSADKVFINTAGVGVILRGGVSCSAVIPGDKLILTGSAGDHGAAVMLAREDLLRGECVESDVAPLNDIVLGLIEAGCEIHAMRDPTRGGIAAALNDMARQSRVLIEIDEASVVVKPAVKAACEALGLDLFNVANEGKMLIFVSPGDAEKALSIVRSRLYGVEARIVGEARQGPSGQVHLKTVVGTVSMLRPPVGEMLPRIC